MMKRKNLLRLLVVMMAAVLSVGFASCGGDDDEDVTLSNESEVLLGGWNIEGAGMNIVLMTKGKLLFYKSNQSVYEGNWNYNEQTGVLATDVSSYQWNVNLIAEDSWAGIGLWNQKPARATKNIAFTAGILLAGRTWTFNGIEKNYGFYIYSQYKGVYDYTPYVVNNSERISLTNVSEDRSKDVISIIYQGELYEIHHPYNYDTIYLLLPSGNKYHPKK